MHRLPKGPFPLPFKGKGEEAWNRKALQQSLLNSQSQCEEIERGMHALIARFDETFGSPLTATLTLHRTGNGIYLRWRMAGSGQSYFTLANNPTGEAFISQLPRSVMRVIFEFEQQRLRLNLQHGIALYQARSIKRYLAESVATHQLSRCHVTPPNHPKEQIHE